MVRVIGKHNHWLHTHTHTHLFDEPSQVSSLARWVHVSTEDKPQRKPVTAQEVEDIVLLQLRSTRYINDEVAQLLPRSVGKDTKQYDTLAHVQGCTLLCFSIMYSNHVPITDED